jgi:hypothetical protein
MAGIIQQYDRKEHIATYTGVWGLLIIPDKTQNSASLSSVSHTATKLRPRPKLCNFLEMLTHITNEEWRTRHGGTSEVIKWKLRGSYNLHATVIKKLGYYSHARQVQHLAYFIVCLTPTKLAPIGQQEPEFLTCLCVSSYGKMVRLRITMLSVWLLNQLNDLHETWYEFFFLRPPRLEPFNFPQPVITIWRKTFRCDISATIYVAYGIEF